MMIRSQYKALHKKANEANVLKGPAMGASCHAIASVVRYASPYICTIKGGTEERPHGPAGAAAGPNDTSLTPEFPKLV